MRNAEVIESAADLNTLTQRYTEEATHFIESSKAGPFFLYMPHTFPHIPLAASPRFRGKSAEGLYGDAVEEVDWSVGEVLQTLKRNGLEKNTLVMFSSDNGSVDAAGGHDLAFFRANGALRSEKGFLYEGGIRVPLIARWPGHIPPGSECRVPAAFCDLFPTFCALAGASVPEGLDGRSLVDVLMGRSSAPPHEFLYWEFSGYGGQQAVRLGDWKGIRVDLQKRLTELELYDLSKDVGEKENVAARRPEVVDRILEIMKREHSTSSLFRIPLLDEGK
jgi:arylsulfatase